MNNISYFTFNSVFHTDPWMCSYNLDCERQQSFDFGYKFSKLILYFNSSRYEDFDDNMENQAINDLINMSTDTNLYQQELKGLNQNVCIIFVWDESSL